jgi:CRISPR-associated Csx14 family protein
MSTILVSSMGLSPGVVTESVKYLSERNIKPDAVFILTTASAWNKYGKLLSEYLEKEMNITDVRQHPSGIEDIRNVNDELRMMNEMRDHIREAEPGKNRVIINIAGGRKTMSADLLLLGLMHNVELVIHVLSNKGEKSWNSIAKDVENKSYSELNDELKKKLHEAFQPDDIDAVIYPLFLLKDKSYMKAIYLYLNGKKDFAEKIPYKGKTLEYYIKYYKLDEREEYKKAITTLINFLEDTIPSPVSHKEELRPPKFGGHHPVDLQNLMKVAEEIRKKDYVRKIEFTLPETTIKSSKVIENDIDIVKANINDSGTVFIIPIQVKERQASELYVYTTAYTEDQRKYVKEDLIKILKELNIPTEV